ncbi:MAG: MarR family winged helix-turn-helix transcriptional regulator [Erysipelotrichaceae bacterium]
MDEQLIKNLHRIAHTMRMQSEGKASQKRILVILLEADGLTQKELTELLAIQPGSVSEILTKLENANLIVRIENENDRRTADLKLTEAGVEAALEAKQDRIQRHKEMFSCLTDEQKQSLLSLLETINRDWQERYPSSNAGKGCKKHQHHSHHQGK